MRRKILITVSYLVEAEQGDFWTKNGRLQNDVVDGLRESFPAELVLTIHLTGHRQSLSNRMIDYPHSNLHTCPVCKRLITDPTKPNPIHTLPQAKLMAGVLLCDSCAWELEGRSSSR